MPQYCASLDVGVSREKAPAVAQLFGRRVTVPIPGRLPDPLVLFSVVIRHSIGENAKATCCRFVTVETNRNCAVNADAKLSRIVRPVYDRAFAPTALLSLR